VRKEKNEVTPMNTSCDVGAVTLIRDIEKFRNFADQGFKQNPKLRLMFVF